MIVLNVCLQMWASLSKLAALPDDTLVYCGHEYTMVSVFPEDLQKLNEIFSLLQK
jgi:glyoxylase-like metal-dependent hydrolase (beta-lactamase superfamily II)